MSSKKKAPRTGKRGKGKVLVPKWKLFRAKEPLLSVFMWGVNHTIGELMHVPPPGLLMPDDFRASTKIKVDYHLFNKFVICLHFEINLHLYVYIFSVVTVEFHCRSCFV
uniref:Phosphatidylinositol N-acetylglucosaminyltransferase subunit Q n=1 Tax=Ascaris lumbricoides TaxID=6252 RepID=A0A0M3HKX7_ASCLU